MPITLLQPSIEPPPKRKPISAFLGQVIFGDCVRVMRCMPTQSVDLVVTDPPYLVSYRPRDGRRCFNDDNDAWLEPSFREMYRLLKPDAFCATFYGWPWIDRFMAAWQRAGFRPVSHLVWLKEYSSREGYTSSHHEVGYLLAKGHPPRPTKPISDVLPWGYTGNAFHPNQKPVVAIKPLIETYCKAGGVVLDPFAGSGTTAVAAQSCGRHSILIEKEQRYWRAAKARLALPGASSRPGRARIKPPAFDQPIPCAATRHDLHA
jgi:adenine-specific DNA-methyltransferase